MRMRIYQGETGEVVLGIDIPYGFVPVMVWPTWSEYMSFIEAQNQFVEESYRRAIMNHSLVGYIESIKEIDNLR